MRNKEPFAFAGLWETWRGRGNDFVTFSIITTVTNGLTAKFHERMPVILKPTDESRWLKEVAPDLLKPYPSELMDMYPVSPAMNKATFKGPESIEPITPP